MDKGLWMEKGSAHTSEGDANLSNTTRFRPKRSYNWFVDATESELYPNKKQEMQNINSKPVSEMLYASINPWENSSALQSVPDQFMGRLFANETASSVNFVQRNLSSIGTDDLHGRRKENDNQFSEDVPIGLSISRAAEDPEICLSYAGTRKVKVNQVKDCNDDIYAPREHNSNNNDISTVKPFNMKDTSFVSVGQAYDKEHDSMVLTGHAFNTDDVQIRSTAPNYARGDGNTISTVDNFVKADTNVISFDGFSDEQVIIPVGRPFGSYGQVYQPASVVSSVALEKELHTPDTNAVLNSSHAVKPKIDSVLKSKSECKTARKEAPNSFPSNVRSLISTGMLDGVPVKYISLAQEELRGVIKGSGYLCGCQSCNFTKVLNAYEFERHAGSKTKHPNNHIFFENGKTIYQAVQELRNTPGSLLFDTIQTVFGAPINQKSFRVWKESFQAATRELQRIYGKEEMNL